MQALSGAEVLIYLDCNQSGVDPATQTQTGVRLKSSSVCGVLVSCSQPDKDQKQACLSQSAGSQSSGEQLWSAEVLLPLSCEGEEALLTRTVQMTCDRLRRLSRQPANGFVAANNSEMQVRGHLQCARKALPLLLKLQDMQRKMHACLCMQAGAYAMYICEILPLQSSWPVGRALSMNHTGAMSVCRTQPN